MGSESVLKFNNVEYEHGSILDLNINVTPIVKSKPCVYDKGLDFNETLMLVKSFKNLKASMPIELWKPLTDKLERNTQIAKYQLAQPKSITLVDIKRKIHLEKYMTPWDYIYDVSSMLYNAYNFFTKNGTLSLQIKRVFLLFNWDLNRQMKSLGYCCGFFQTYNVKTIFCRNYCQIQPYERYFQNHHNNIILCVKCFRKSKNPSLTSKSKTIEDGLMASEDNFGFVQKIHFFHVEEPYCTCKICHKIFHCLCVQFLHVRCPLPEPQSFICSNCQSEPQPKSILSASSLKSTPMGDFIEKRVKEILRNNDSTSKVLIRVVHSELKKVEVQERFRLRLNPFHHKEIPYTSRSIFAFQDLDGEDVCFLAMQVQEYGSTDFSQNNRRAYISYIDSVRLFDPPQLRTKVYHTIILAYLENLKSLGYANVHIWACPPSQRTEDYIFYRHPPNQKSPTEKMLLSWYDTMIKLGIQKKIIHSSNSLHKSVKDKGQSVHTVIPYFEGDFWPKEIEYIVEQSEKIYFAKNKRRRLEKNFEEDINEKIIALSKKNENIFIVINLINPDVSTNKVHVKRIKDPNPLLKCDILHTRDNFLHLLVSHDLEFVDLRRAKYATKFIINAILKFQSEEAYALYQCNGCENNLEEIRYSCKRCEDFDLCVKCNETSSHHHPLFAVKMGLFSLNQRPDSEGVDENHPPTPPRQRSKRRTT